MIAIHRTTHWCSCCQIKGEPCGACGGEGKGGGRGGGGEADEREVKGVFWSESELQLPSTRELYVVTAAVLTTDCSPAVGISLFWQLQLWQSSRRPAYCGGWLVAAFILFCFVLCFRFAFAVAYVNWHAWNLKNVLILKKDLTIPCVPYVRFVLWTNAP